MSFDKYYPNRKDWRNRNISGDRSCRNHGSCSWCKNNRLHNSKKRKFIINQKLKDFFN